MKFYLKLKAFADRMAEVLLWISTFFMCVLIFASFMQVFTRYVLNSSWPWTEELARYSFIWTILSGAAAGLHRGGLVAVTILPDALHGLAKRIVVGFSYVCLLFGSLIFLIYGAKLVMLVGGSPSVVMRIPMGFVHVSLAISGLCMTVGSVCGLMRCIFTDLDEEKEVAE